MKARFGTFIIGLVASAATFTSIFLFKYFKRTSMIQVTTIAMMICHVGSAVVANFGYAIESQCFRYCGGMHGAWHWTCLGTVQLHFLATMRRAPATSATSETALGTKPPGHPETS